MSAAPAASGSTSAGGAGPGDGDATTRFVETLAAIDRATLDAAAISSAEARLIDYLGVALAGVPVLGEGGRRLAEFHAETPGACTLVGRPQRVSPQSAALLNGMAAHAAELDDGNRFGAVHPGAPVISAAIAAGEWRDLPMGTLLHGIVVGYEVAIRIASLLQPALKEKQYHATGVCGTLGAAAAVATMLDATPLQFHAAFAAAVTSAGGLLKAIRDDSELKPFNAGRAAGSGLDAALIGLSGLRGPIDPIAGRGGLLEVFGGGSADLAALLAPAREPLGVDQVYLKPYAACRHCHPAIEAAIILRERHRLAAGDVERIEVRTYRWAVGGHDHVEIGSVPSGKMSVPFSVAVAIARGAASLREFSDAAIEDPALLDLTRRVTVIADPELTARVPQERPAIVEIRCRDGRRFSEQVDLPKGEPERALTTAELRSKFHDLADFSGCSPPRAEAILAAAAQPQASVRTLTGLL